MSQDDTLCALRAMLPWPSGPVDPEIPWLDYSLRALMHPPGSPARRKLAARAASYRAVALDM